MSKRTSGFLFLLTLFCTWLIPQTVQAKNHQVFSTITVMSYNIHWGVGEGDRYDLSKVAADVVKAKADIVGLQEVDVHWGDRSSFDNQVEKLAQRLNMHAYFAPIYILNPVHPGAPLRQHGVAVLSKFPILEAKNHQITRLSTIHPGRAAEKLPGFAEVVVRLGQVDLSVLVTHLDYREDPAIRRTQVQETVQILRSVRKPHILLGDLNAPPQAPELAPLFRTLDNALSACSGLCKSFPADRPIVLIDYILTSTSIRVQRAGTLATTASDHQPVFAVLKIPMYSSRPEANQERSRKPV